MSDFEPNRGVLRLSLMTVVTVASLGLAWFQSAASRLPADGSPEIIFNHRYHIEDEGLECSDCHAGAEESMAGTDNLLPVKEVCADCHDVEDEDECSSCHTNISDPQPAARIEDYSPTFSHQAHLEAELECSSCHGGIELTETSGAGMLPGMVQCLDCHDQHAVTSVDCALCHGPNENLVPDNHSPDFIHAHSDIARAGVPMKLDKTCQTCHDTNFCQDCHEGDNLERQTHPLNFEFTHALNAQADERLCVSCHTDRQECVDCHRANSIMPQSHVPGFVNPVDGGLHAFEATNDIESCISCHNANAEQICQPCHGSP